MFIDFRFCEWLVRYGCTDYQALYIRLAKRSKGLDLAEGRSQASRLRQVVSYLRNMGMAGLVSAWAMARRRPKEYRRKVDAASNSHRKNTG